MPQNDTEFAPAERASPVEVTKQHKQYADLALVQEMIDAMPDPFLVLNEQRQAVLVNQALITLIAAKRPLAALGKRPGELLSCVHATEKKGGCGTTEFCSECGAVRAILTSLDGQADIRECRITQQDGSCLDLRVWATPLRVNGKTFSIFAVKDIADEKRRRVLERIFFHDVLNTAGGIVMFGDLLKRMTPEEIPDMIDEFESLTTRLISEIQAQRELTSAETGELSPVPVPISAHQIMREVYHQYKRRAILDEKHIEVYAPRLDVTFISDKTLVGRVLGNMLKNALEAIPKGETVTFRGIPEDEDIRFEVHNAGFIPRDVQLQIFQRSFSTKGAGRGLGTYSIKMLTEKYLCGRVGFRTSPTDGTCFWATYPLVWEGNGSTKP